MGAQSQKKPVPLDRKFNPCRWELLLIDLEELGKSIELNDPQVLHGLIEYYSNEIEKKKEILAEFLFKLDQDKLLLLNHETIRNHIKKIYLKCIRIPRTLNLINKLMDVNGQVDRPMKELQQQIQELYDTINSSEPVSYRTDDKFSEDIKQDSRKVCKTKIAENTSTSSTNQSLVVVKNTKSEVVNQINQENQSSANIDMSTPIELSDYTRRIESRRNPQKKPIRQQSVSNNDNRIEVSQKTTKKQNGHITGKQKHDVPTKRSRSGHHNETSSRKNKRQIHPQGLLVDKQKIRKKKKIERRRQIINTYTRRLPRVRKRMLSLVAMSRNKSLNNANFVLSCRIAYKRRMEAETG